MYITRIGAVSPLLVLDDVLRDRHDDLRVTVDREIMLRRERGVPLDGLEALAPYETNADYASIEIRVRTVTRSLLEEVDVLLRDVASRQAGDTGTVLRVHEEAVELQSRLVAAAVVEVRGLVDDGGVVVIANETALTNHDVELLRTNGLLIPLFAAAKSWGYLSGEARGRCGKRQPLTSAPRTSAVTSVPSDSGLTRDVTVLRPTDGSVGGEPSSSTTHAHVDTCSGHRGSALRLGSSRHATGISG